MLKLRNGLLAVALVAAAVAGGSPAVAAEPDGDAAQALIKKNDCGKCHALDKEKKASSWKKTAAKYKGKADAEAAALKATIDPGGDHPEFKAKPEDTKAVIKWMLTQ